MVTDKQVRRYRDKRAKGFSQEAAAAAAGMDVKSARKFEHGGLPSTVRVPHTWRTREDPLAEFWEKHAVPLLTADPNGQLQAKTILEELKAKCPEHCTDTHLRTVQRRVREWRALYGPGHEVYFQQEHLAGRESQIDFTHGTELGVTIRGMLFEHLWFELVLSCSGQRYVELAFGETYEALTQGLQNAFFALGGTTQFVRSDNLSAATHQLKQDGGRHLTARFKKFLEHFGINSTRINAGRSNENGKVEKAHDVYKTALQQALLLRGSADFDSVEDYVKFALTVAARLNDKTVVAFAAEQPHLGPLPSSRFPCYTETRLKVTRWSIIRVGHNTYSVHSRLIGHTVGVRVHPDTVEIRLGDKVVDSFPRLRGQGKCRIDYRHIIHSLKCKPGAFARYVYREELFPSVTFRRAYDALGKQRGERADVEYVRILHLAATTMEVEVEAALEVLLELGQPFDYGTVKELVEPKLRPAPVECIPQPAPEMSEYDKMLSGEMHVQLTQWRTPQSEPGYAAA
ncbi:MAG: IS21 family transposase [Candidatus Xenobia bacterium]